MSIDPDVTRSSRALLGAAISAALLLAGCASTYGPKSMTGGYEEQWLGDSRFRVVFHHNGYTSEEMADALVLRRAAELALENEYRYLRVDGELDARHPFIGGTFRHIAEVELLDEATGDGVLEASTIILETEQFADGRLSDTARRRLMEIERERRGN